MPIPHRSHHTASLLKLNKAWAEAKGTPLSLRMLAGRPRSWNALVERLIGSIRKRPKWTGLTSGGL
jgi:hypothetical protein